MAAFATRSSSPVVFSVCYCMGLQYRLSLVGKAVAKNGALLRPSICKDIRGFASYQRATLIVSAALRSNSSKLLTTSNFHTSVTFDGREIVKKAQKMEKSRAKSAELLLKLRRKRLEGLSKPAPPMTPERKLAKRIDRLESIKKLLIFYWVHIKSKREITPLHKFTILQRIVKFFSKDVQMRDVFLVQEMQQKFFQMLVHDVRANASSYDAEQLCKIAVYMAKLRVTDAAVYQGLEREILKYNLGDYTSKQLSLLSWAFAKHRVTVDDIFQALDEEIYSRELSEFTSAELCSIVWSFAEYGIPDSRQFYKKVGGEILTREFSQFEPWMLASVAFAFSRLESLSAKMFKVTEDELFQRGDLKPFDTNDLVLLVLAFGRTNNLHPKLFQKMEPVLVRRRDFSETVNKEHLEEVYHYLKNSQFHLAEVAKIIELVLNPGVFNSVFDVLYRPRRAWKEKILHQHLFKAY